MNAYDTIRSVLSQSLSPSVRQAFDALAELERAAAVVDRSKFVRGEICGCQARPTHYVGEMDCPWHKRGDGQPPPAPVAEIREVVVTDEMGKKVYEKWVCLPRRIGCSFAVSHGIDMIAAVRSELGPALGLVEIREPTPEVERKDYALTAIIQLAERRAECADILTIARTARLPEKD